ncbi:hypothetical protein [uncultured Clostridium sp.]|uniref:hypothetical protein n=1 Tax=uncultured Clostridium sp. TaxID=59620 RepID=UPI00262A614A|nr:hypothetical protein [uncultured Clostridium sp.]
MLFKKVRLTVSNGYSCSIDSPLRFFKNDSLYLKFEIFQIGIEHKNNISRLRERPMNGAISAILLIENPFGIDSVESMDIEDNLITFALGEEHTQYPGVSKMQIVLLDENRYKVTLPDFEFEIKKSINEEWDGEEVIYPTILLTDDGSVILVDEETALIR